MCTLQIPWILTFASLTTMRIFLEQSACCVCGKFVNCYKFSSAAFHSHTHKHTFFIVHFLIIYARLVRSRQRIVEASERMKKNKETVSLILAPVTARDDVASWNLSICEKNSTCGSYFARYSWAQEATTSKTKTTTTMFFVQTFLFSCHVHVLGKYYDRTTWNYHPRSDIKATPSSVLVTAR